jgi:all-trans-8'-apo-beta-carotenal 15,15'-oxygenase
MTSLPDKHGFSLEDYAFLFQSQPKELIKELSADDIEGTLPKDIVGSYFLNGPGLLQIDGDWFHPFDGHGFIRSLTFRGDGSCLYRSKYVKTEAYLEETKAGHGVYRGFGMLSGSWWRNWRAKIFKVPANTCVIEWANNLLCLHEGGLPYALDPKTLETRGNYRFQGSLPETAPFLAHTRFDSENNRLLGCSCVPGRQTRLVIYEFCSDGSLYSKIEHSVAGLSYFHDFCFTKNFYIFVSSYLRLKPLSLIKAFMGLQSLPTAITSDDIRDAQLFMIPRPDSKLSLEHPLVYSLNEPLFTIHLGNASEENEKVTLYTCSFKTFTIGNELGYYPCRPGYFDPLANGGGAAQYLLCLQVNWKENYLNKTWLDNTACDFPEVHPYREGQTCRYLYACASIFDDLYFPFHSIVKYDLYKGTKESWQCDRRDFIGEAVFIPKQVQSEEREEDDAYLIAAIYRSEFRRVEFAIFDSKHIEQGPLCRIRSPQPFPYGFHGSFTENVFVA